MTWHFDYTIPSLIFLLFFLIFYFLKPILLKKSNRCFFSLVIAEIIGFFITYLSCYLDNSASNYNRFLLYLLNSLYYVFYISRYFIVSLFFAYLFNVKIGRDIPTIITIISSFVIITLVLITPFNKLIYTLTEEGKYTTGSQFILIYIANIITLILDSYYLIRFHNKLTTKEIISTIFTILALLACGFVDIFYTYYVITDMFFLFVILILFLSFENPDIYIDKKTTLYNVQSFTNVINEYLASHRKYSLISFIIQNYPEKKQIYGTKQMDAALKEIGKFFHSLFRNKKYFYLQNGRFILIDSFSADFSKIKEIIINRFNQPWIVHNSELHLNILAIDTDKNLPFNSLEDITVGFGMAIKEAKKTSKNCITINKDSLNAIIKKTKVAKALNKALLDDSLQVYLQPVVEVSTRKVVGAEALVRIMDDELGLIPPVEFISMAEKNGSIEQLGEQVLNKVCVYIKHSHIYDKDINWINVNLSPVQCQNNNLPHKIDNITNVNKIDHNYIHLEITEEAIIDTPILKKQMNILITDGYKFSLDDFGSGFSNIARVKTLPFNNIKLDMSIVWDHFDSPDDMLPNIVKTFRSRNLTVTAEGVETKEMADALEKMGCNFLQGYYYSKPVPMDEFESVVDKINNK